MGSFTMAIPAPLQTTHSPTKRQQPGRHETTGLLCVCKPLSLSVADSRLNPVHRGDKASSHGATSRHSASTNCSLLPSSSSRPAPRLHVRGAVALAVTLRGLAAHGWTRTKRRPRQALRMALWGRSWRVEPFNLPIAKPQKTEHY